MGLSTPTVPKDKDRDRLLDGPGVALVATTLHPTIRTGMDKEITLNPLNHAFLLKTTTLWICLPLSTKPQTTKNTRNTERQANASNAESKATLSATVLTKRHALVQLAPFKLKMITNQSPLTPHL